MKICVREADERRNRPAEYVCAGEPTWPRVLRERTDDQERAVAYAERHVTEFQAKVDNWKLDELPEFKLAKLFGKFDAQAV